MATHPDQGIRPDGPHACYRNPRQRSALMALLDDGFPGLSGAIARAADAGFHWESVTEPFIAWEGDAAIGHVGVIEHRVRVAGQDLVMAGIHAVVTRRDRRGRGVARRLLAEALAYADTRCVASKLGTDLPAVYAPHGFSAVPLHKFAVAHRGGKGGGRPLRDEERDWLLETCARRDPVSHRFASLDPGWLVGIDLALQGRSIRDLVVLDPLDAIVDWTMRDDTLEIHDVIAPALPTLEAILRFAPPHRAVELFVCPDRLAPDARPIPMPDAGVWMFRGACRPPAAVPIGVSRLAEH